MAVRNIELTLHRLNPRGCGGGCSLACSWVRLVQARVLLKYVPCSGERLVQAGVCSKVWLAQACALFRQAFFWNGQARALFRPGALFRPAPCSGERLFMGVPRSGVALLIRVACLSRLFFFQQLLTYQHASVSHAEYLTSCRLVFLQVKRVTVDFVRVWWNW